MKQRPVDIIVHLDLESMHLGTVQREHRFHKERKWRFDFAIPSAKLAVEIEGGTWSGGRHTRGSGYQADLEKYNTALAMGWKVFRFSTHDVLHGEGRHFLNMWHAFSIAPKQ